MIVFEKLIIQNFLSYGNDSTTIDLNVSKPTLITGVNYDASVNGELDSNGCGKSSILNALSYVLYNKAISIGEKLDHLINNINKKDMMVCVYFKKDKTNYRITRYRKNKALGGEGVLIEQKKSGVWKDITTTKPEIQISETILQIPFTVFNRIIGYAAGEEPFLKMGLPKQREVIDELFEYTELMKKAEKVKELIKNLEKDLEYARESQESIREESARHAQQLESIKNKQQQWEDSRRTFIAESTKELEELSSIDFEKEAESIKHIQVKSSKLSTILTELKQFNGDLNNVNSIQEKFLNFDNENSQNLKQVKQTLKDETVKNFDPVKSRQYVEQMETITEELTSFRNEKTSKQSEITSNGKKLNKLAQELSHLEDEKCPYCLQDYQEAKTRVAEVKENIKSIAEANEVLSSDIGTIVTSIDALNSKLEGLDSKAVFKTVNEIQRYENKIDQLVKEIERLENNVNPYEDQSEIIKNLNEKIDKMNESVDSIEAELEEYSEKLLFHKESDMIRARSRLDMLSEKINEKINDVNPFDSIVSDLEAYTPKKGKEKEIAKMEATLEHAKFLVKLLTKKDSYLRKALMDKYLPLLNRRLHHYLRLMTLPHMVVFNSDLSTEIRQFDKSIPYGNLSAGQKARINIALSLSFRDVLQSKHNFINLFILDECLDVGLSNVGVRKTVKAIRDVAKTNKLSMFVISHRDEAKESFPDKLEIELRNGFSTIKKGA